MQDKINMGLIETECPWVIGTGSETQLLYVHISLMSTLTNAHKLMHSDHEHSISSHTYMHTHTIAYGALPSAKSLYLLLLLLLLSPQLFDQTEDLLL